MRAARDEKEGKTTSGKGSRRDRESRMNPWHTRAHAPALTHPHVPRIQERRLRGKYAHGVRAAHGDTYTHSREA